MHNEQDNIIIHHQAAIIIIEQWQEEVQGDHIEESEQWAIHTEPVQG